MILESIRFHMYVYSYIYFVSLMKLLSVWQNLDKWISFIYGKSLVTKQNFYDNQYKLEKYVYNKLNVATCQ